MTQVNNVKLLTSPSIFHIFNCPESLSYLAYRIVPFVRQGRMKYPPTKSSIPKASYIKYYTRTNLKCTFTCKVLSWELQVEHYINLKIYLLHFYDWKKVVVFYADCTCHLSYMFNNLCENFDTFQPAM